MRPVLAVFIDGLKFEGLDAMPFLGSLPHRRRMRTLLGYSITCHASMYSGLYPDRHLMWFLWKYAPETSPFRWMPESRILDYVNNLPARYFLGKMARVFSSNTSYGGVAVMKRSALSNWRYFDTAEKKLWDEDGYLEGCRTVFEIAREKGCVIDAVGLKDVKHDGGGLEHIRAYSTPSVVPDVTYLFIGEVDHVSHVYGQESAEAREVMIAVDREVERIYVEMRERAGSEPAVMAWSDHGHMRIKEQYDIYEHFNSRGADLDRFIHIIDANFARFWFRDPSERERVERLLEDMPSGFVLDRTHMEKYRTVMPDNRYGDLIYYLDHPYMFKKTVWGYGMRTSSIHGFLPDYAEKDGVFAASAPVAAEGHAELVDVAPSLLELAGIDPEGTGARFDGKSLWGK